jgi:MoxR-like ATPase
MPKIQKELKEWQIFQAVMKDPSIRRVLLYGPPGTGKTTAAVKSSGAKRHYNLTLHEESSVAELIGHWVPKGSEFLFHHGPLTKSWTEGALFVANEIDHSCGAVLSILLAALDDDGVAHLDLPTGETVKPTKDFRFIATMNGNPSDLPEPLIDRFDIMLKISSPSIPAIDALPKDLRHLCRNAYTNRNDLHITYRQIQALTKLRAIISLDDALNTVFGLKKAKDIKMVIKAGERDEKKIK